MPNLMAMIQLKSRIFKQTFIGPDVLNIVYFIVVFP